MENPGTNVDFTFFLNRISLAIFYDQIGKTRAAMGRAAIIAHSYIIIFSRRSL
jgi:hypothetical protein